jgi:formylglycine-generating enzyme required for sulfatase activity
MPAIFHQNRLIKMAARFLCAGALLYSLQTHAAETDRLYQSWTRQQEDNPPVAAKAAADYLSAAPSGGHARQLRLWLINYDEAAQKVGFPHFDITPAPESSPPRAQAPVSGEQLYQTWADEHTRDQRAAAKAAADYLSTSPSGDHREEVREWLDVYNKDAQMFGFPVVTVRTQTAMPGTSPSPAAPPATSTTAEAAPETSSASDQASDTASNQAAPGTSPSQTTAMLTPPPSPPATEALIPHPPAEVVRKPFKDCPDCPEMMPLPSGSFTMGSPDSEDGHYKSEEPQHSVTISKAFAMGVYDVTFDEWNACLAAGGCGGYTPSDEGWGTGNHPVINVSDSDAQAYVDWLNRSTGQHYRIPSEAEWEYAARATTHTPYFWGDEASRQYAVYAANGTLPVGSTSPNNWGLYDMLGNVSQWTADCYNADYTNAPVDGSAWVYGDCKQRIFRGGAWMNKARQIRAASRNWSDAGARFNDRGFRVVRDLQ